MARRFTIFVLLGPFLIWLQYMILQVPDLIRNPDGAPLGFFGLVLVIVAMLGVVPGSCSRRRITSWRGERCRA